jgi:transposase
MRKIREILRLQHLGRSQRQIASSVSTAVGTVCGHLQRAAERGIGWEQAEPMSDAELEALLFRDAGRNQPAVRAPIDFGHVHRELRRTGVTLLLLWSEYQDGVVSCSDVKPYQYSQFCELYAAWRTRLSPSMRQVHLAGEKGFIDYSGKKPRLWDPISGEAREVELFVMTLGASNYTYAEASHTQGLHDFVGSTIRALEFFGGAPTILVPDQLRSAVKGPDRYEPDINATYLELAQHYGTTVVPARPRKPKDKAKVELAVLVVQRWILAKLRNRIFFELSELNQAIWELLDELNARPFQKMEGSRGSVFEELERGALLPLPATRYELSERRNAGVNIDYHVEFDHRHYSVPFKLVHERVEVRATQRIVEIFLKLDPKNPTPKRDHGYRDGDRVATHQRNYGRRGSATTEPTHRPPNHRAQVWPPERLVSWAEKFGPAVAEVVERMLARYVVPEQSYRACLGLLRAAERHGEERMNAACERALQVNSSPSRKYIEAILKRGLDQRSPVATATQRAPLLHENVRGGAYYDRKETLN